MKVTVTTRHLNNRKMSNVLRDYALKKIPRIERFMHAYKEPSEIKLILEAQKFRNTAEIIVSDGNLKATASVEMADMHAAIDRVVDTIIKQLRRKSDKYLTVKRRQNYKASNSLDSVSNSKQDTLQSKDISIEKLPLKPMPLEEAMLQLNVSKEKFLVFRNSETGEMNVVYNKKNSIVGLITP